MSTITISGINATELYSFGAVLGLIIEEEVVRTLNNLRQDWYPGEKYLDYIFIRQPETFPDMLLKKTDGDEIILGIELKS